jgi:ABC-2 type transport system permease protein
MSSFVQYGAVWLAQVRYTVMRELMFKANFILWVIVDLCWFGLNLAFVQFLYLQVDSIAGWTKWEMILLVTTNMLVQQIFQMLFMTNLNKLPELIRTGGLDFFLAQPASAQFLISTRLFELGSVVNVLFTLIVCLIAIAENNWSFSLSGLVIYPLLVVFGVLIHYSVLLMLMSLAFWMTRAQGFINAYYSTLQIARLPREVFHGPTRIVFTYGLPLLLIANVPASTLLHGWNFQDLAVMGGMTAILVTISTAVFQAGLRRYGSASS